MHLILKIKSSWFENFWKLVSNFVEAVYWLRRNKNQNYWNFTKDPLKIIWQLLKLIPNKKEFNKGVQPNFIKKLNCLLTFWAIN